MEHFIDIDLYSGRLMLTWLSSNINKKIVLPLLGSHKYTIVKSVYTRL